MSDMYTINNPAVDHQFQDIGELEEKVLADKPKVANLEFSKIQNQLGLPDSNHVLRVMIKNKNGEYEYQYLPADNETIKFLSSSIGFAYNLEENKIKTQMNGIPYCEAKPILMHYIRALKERNQNQQK